MNYETALAELRGRTVAPAPLDQMRQRQAAAQRNRLPKKATSIAMVMTAIAALAFVGLTVRPAVFGQFGVGVRTGVAYLSIATLLPAGILGWALRLVRQHKLGAQLLCRAIWWSNLIVGVLIASNFVAGGDRALGAVAAIACAWALLATGRRGLDGVDPAHPFSPVRFRGHLLLALVMAFADAQTLMFSALMQLRIGMDGWTLLGTVTYAGPTVAAAAVMSLAVWGVYRLRTWALLLNLVANLAIAYLALTGVLSLALSVSVTLATTAAVQCILPVPILATALGDRNAGRPLLRGSRRWLISASIAGLAGWSVIAAVLVHSADGWQTGGARAFARGFQSRPRLPPRERYHLYGFELQNRRLRGADLTGAQLAGSDLSGSFASFVKFVESDLRGVDLSGANLAGADFSGANLGQTPADTTRFDNANLRGAMFSRDQPTSAQVRSWRPYLCPDGREPSPVEGCQGRMGRLDTDSRLLFEIVKEGFSPRDQRCGGEGAVVTAYAGSHTGFMVFRGRDWVRLHNGSFVSGSDTFGDFSWPDKDWRLLSQSCGEEVFRPLPAQR